MYLNGKHLAIFSVSVFAVSFLSSCGKSERSNNAEGIISANQNTTIERHCTDLSDEAKIHWANTNGI